MLSVPPLAVQLFRQIYYNMSTAPGDPLSVKSNVLNAVAGGTQNFGPIKHICEHVCGFHGYAHDMTRQVHAHHMCSHVNEDFRQCIIYDSPEPTARLIGIEYIISEKLFDQLDAEEKKFWHSHDYEVRGGSLALPMPKMMPELGVEAAERQSLIDLQKTYGKTWHTWQIDRGDALPLGPPQLMMSFTKDGQLNADMAKKREEQEGINLEVKKKERADFPVYTPRKEADQWQSGKAVQLNVETVDVKTQ
ncbi:hypothetical protein NQZ79_g4897 [Umbelopsis isabellina]|nr:hypothetical protein NQZ79_g4897 [Umbelopsis isabellina]